MGKLVLSENTSLDGVVEDPTGEEGLAHGGWFGRIADADREAWSEAALAEALAAAALLLGRRSDRWFAARWPSRTGRWADRLNGLPKYVVSSTAAQPAWSNATVLTGNVADEVRALKQRVDGDIVVYGSIALTHTLIEHDLIDELRLVVFPVVLGSGRRLFGDTAETRPLRLLGARALGGALVHLTYERARDAP